MKVLVVLGICLLIAVCLAEEKPDEHHRHCCGQHKQDYPASLRNVTCVTFLELVESNEREYLESHNPDLEKFPDAEFKKFMSPVIRLQAKIKAFSTSALDCIPNNRIFRSVHKVLDALESIVASPHVVLNKIAEAQDFMEQHFDDLAALHYADGMQLPSHLLGRIGDFFADNVHKAEEVFRETFDRVHRLERVARDDRLLETFARLVRRVDSCLDTWPVDFDSIFACRNQVRSLGTDLGKRVDYHRLRMHRKPELSLERFLFNFTGELKELESLIALEK